MNKNKREAFFYDGGRNQTKTANDGSLTDTYPSGVMEISLTEYEDACERNRYPSADYLLWNNRAFVIGSHASYYGILGKKATSARYAIDDFGIAAISGILRYGFESRSVDIITSHPPLDGQYKDKMKSAVLGCWEVESAGQVVSIDVERVFTQEEPVSLLRFMQLTDDGGANKQSPLYKRSLICDSGGQTFDLTATDSNGRVVNALTGSRPIGINHYLETFERAIRVRYRDFFASTEKIDPLAIRDAFASGWFVGGGTSLDCTFEANQQKTSYLNRALQFINDKTGGVTNFDTVILGGGGAGLLNDDFKEAVNHGNIHFVDNNLAQIHTSGVRGLRREFVQWRKMNLV